MTRKEHEMFKRRHGTFEPFGEGAGFGGPFRAGRGMMEPAILGALAEKPMHGYEIISHLEKKSHGLWRPSAGSVYPTLQLLEEKDLVVYCEENGKKIYRLTPDGEKEAETSRDHTTMMFERFAGMDRVSGRRMNLHHDYQRQFHKQAGEIMKSMRHIFRKGSARQKEAMDTAVNDFKIRLEAIERGEI